MNGLPEEADPSSAEWNEANVTVECPWFRSGKPSKGGNETIRLIKTARADHFAPGVVALTVTSAGLQFITRA